jgi:hypothetical protein
VSPSAGSRGHGGGDRLETIHVRLSAGSPVGLLSDLRELAGRHTPGTDLRVYRRLGMSADYGIHIVFAGSDPNTAPSRLGLRLASALREYGLVEHSMWEEECIDDSRTRT